MGSFFVIIGIFLIKTLIMRPCLCNGCHDLMQKAVSFNNVAVISAKGSDYRIDSVS